MSNKPTSSVGRTVILVDDDPIFVRLLSQGVRQRGFIVISQSRAFGILNTIATHRPALLVVDVMMPGLDGPSIAELVRKDPDLRATPVVLCSSIEPTLLAKRAAECQADGYVSKTMGLSSVISDVTRLLSELCVADS